LLAASVTNLMSNASDLCASIPTDALAALGGIGDARLGGLADLARLEHIKLRSSS
jgi:hypothetical protein